jgi:hypothetical protein
MECSDSIFAKYQQLLDDQSRFDAALAQTSESGAGGVSVQSLLSLLDMLVDMLAECGLQQLKSVYTAIKRHASVHFEECMTWQTCHLSGISARGCLRLGEGVFVHRQHTKWVLSVWLSTHMRELERSRQAVPPENAAVYRAALKCVFEQLHGSYVHVATHLKKNNVLAWAQNSLGAANDNPC